jgi:hypothetical protein
MTADHNHIQGRDALGNANNELDPGIGSLQYGISRKRSGNEDNTRIGAGLSYSALYGIEHGNTIQIGPSLIWSNTGNHICPILYTAARVEAALTAGDTLN